MVRNHSGSIFGIWFYDQVMSFFLPEIFTSFLMKVECERVGNKIEELVKEVESQGKNGGSLGYFCYGNEEMLITSSQCYRWIEAWCSA